MKLTSILAFLTMIGGAVTASAAGAETGTSTYDDITWTYTKVSTTDPKTAKLIGSSYKACMSPDTHSGEVTIPVAFANKVYTNIAIEANAFINCSQVTKFRIPSTVETVNGAFVNCTALTTISFAASKISFNDNAFVNCPNFTAFELTGDAAASYAVDGGALYNADKTQLLRVPTGLTELSIPATVTKIGTDAFAYSAVKTLALPAALQTFVATAFNTASSLESFSISDTNPTYATRNGVLYSADLKTLIRVPPACANLVILSGVTNIANYACQGCNSLKTVICPSSLKRLEVYAFQGADAIKTITFTGEPPTLGSELSFANIVRNATIQYYKEYASSWSAFLQAHDHTKSKVIHKGMFVTAK